MPEDPIAQRELAALTRRYENNLQIIRGDIAAVDNRLSDFENATAENFDAVREELGTVKGSVEDLGGKLGSFIDEQRAANATLIELLSRQIGQDPNAD